MKKQPSRTRSASNSRARHQFDHVVPTVIHDPEERMTTLGRWTHRLLKDPQKAVTWVAVIVAGLLLTVVGWNLVLSRSQTSDVWSKLEAAKQPEDRIALAKENPKSPAATWALLQAATELYNQALADMPNNRDVAGPMFKRALELFDQVAREAPKDSPQARAAALGKARALESRSDLPKAIEQYQFVAKNWPSTPEGNRAAELAESLEKPEATAFYRELFAYTPTRVTLPPLGTGNVNLPATGTSKTPPPAAGKAPLLPEMPLELAPPEVREVKKPDTKAGEKKVDTKAGEKKVDAKAASPPAKTDATKAKASGEQPKPPGDTPPPKPTPETKSSAPNSK
jgi:tetratricopeptide (TPR) repeat protein